MGPGFCVGGTKPPTLEMLSRGWKLGLCPLFDCDEGGKYEWFVVQLIRQRKIGHAPKNDLDGSVVFPWGDCVVAIGQQRSEGLHVSRGRGEQGQQKSNKMSHDVKPSMDAFARFGA